MLINKLKLLKPETIPLLHYAAHGVNGTVAEVSSQNFPHQLEDQRAAQHERTTNHRGETIRSYE